MSNYRHVVFSNAQKQLFSETLLSSKNMRSLVQNGYMTTQIFMRFSRGLISKYNLKLKK